MSETEFWNVSFIITVEGNNTFRPVIITKEVLAFTNKNVDRDGLETHLIYVVGKYDSEFPKIAVKLSLWKWGLCEILQQNQYQWCYPLLSIKCQSMCWFYTRTILLHYNFSSTHFQNWGWWWRMLEIFIVMFPRCNEWKIWFFLCSDHF